MKAPKISIQIGADTKKLKRDMKKADGIVSKFSTAAKLGLASAAAAAGAFAFKIGKDGVESAIADQKSQVLLESALQKTTKATEEAIQANEELIGQKQLQYGVDDVALRASLAKLARATGSLTKAQNLQAIAMDVAAGAGISLEAATNLIVKAQMGAFTGFKKIGVALDENTIKSKDVDAAMKALRDTFAGDAAKAADTMEGKMLRLNQVWGEAEEAVGKALLPELEKLSKWATSPDGQEAINQGMMTLVDIVQKLGDAFAWLTDRQEAFVKMLDAGWPDDLEQRFAWLESHLDWLAPDVAIDPRTQKAIPNSPRGSSGFRTTGGAPVQITVQGAIDPVSTARQIQKLLNQVPRQPISVDISKRSK